MRREHVRGGRDASVVIHVAAARCHANSGQDRASRDIVRPFCGCEPFARAEGLLVVGRAIATHPKPRPPAALGRRRDARRSRVAVPPVTPVASHLHRAPRPAAAMLALLLVALPAAAEPSALGLDAYLADVGRSSPALRVQRAALSQADAQVVLAHVFPDPVVSAGLASLDVSFVGAQNNVAASVSVPFEWPGLRSARVAASGASRDVAVAELEDAARTVRTAAALAWVDAVYAQRVVAQQDEALQTLKQMVALNERRQQEGAGSELAVLQSRVEARRLEGELATARAQARGLRVALEALAGRAVADDAALPPLKDELPLGPRRVDAESLLSNALDRRADLVARRRAVGAAEAQVTMARAGRVPDVTLGLGWLYYTPGAQGSAYQGPPYHTVSAMLSVPLPLAGRFVGEVQAARAQVQAADANREVAELQATAEVQAALVRYEAARTRLDAFDAQVLADGDRLLEMSRTSYVEGASRLVELLSAQRTWIDLRLSVEAARAEAARATIALEAAAGVTSLPAH